MDLGFEGNFIAHKKSISPKFGFQQSINQDWGLLKKTRFTTVFANDILPEAATAWAHYMSRFGHNADVYHLESIVELVKTHKAGAGIFPDNIDIVTGGLSLIHI